MDSNAMVDEVDTAAVDSTALVDTMDTIASRGRVDAGKAQGLVPLRSIKKSYINLVWSSSTLKERSLCSNSKNAFLPLLTVIGPTINLVKAATGSGDRDIPS